MPVSIGEQMQQLYSQFGHLPGITIELHKELLALNIVNQQATATVFLQGAQVSHFQPKGEQAIIWCSEHCDYQQGQPLRGGIPICWPWFGNLDRNPQRIQQQVPTVKGSLPAHGFVRYKDWQLTAIDLIDDHNSRITLELEVTAEHEPLWPYNCSLQLVISIGAELSLQLRVTNHSTQTLNYSAALHSYFSVSDITNVSIDGLDQMSYIDCVDNWHIKQQQGPLNIDREIDRIYTTLNNSIRILDNNQRTIGLSTGQSNSSVVWNPWLEKSKRLSQFSEDDYLHMLCIESANVMEECVELLPKQHHDMKLTISSYPA